MVCDNARVYLCDFGVCALAIDAIVLKPHALGVRTVLFQRAAVLSLTPHAAEQRVRLQTQAAALPASVTLVQMHWGHRDWSFVIGWLTGILHLFMCGSGLKRFQNVHSSLSFSLTV